MVASSTLLWWKQVWIGDRLNGDTHTNCSGFFFSSSLFFSMSGPNSSSEWSIEGRRLVPLMPRLVPQTAFTVTANAVANAALQHNAALPLPAETGSKEGEGMWLFPFGYWEWERNAFNSWAERIVDRKKKKKEAHYLDTALPAISRSVKHYRCCSITRPLRFCTSVIWDCFFFPSSVVVCYSYTSTTSTPTSTPVPSGSVATVKSPRPASPASNVVVLPSGSAVYVKSKWEKKHYFKPKIGV